jgi:hypothetical protein
MCETMVCVDLKIYKVQGRFSLNRIPCFLMSTEKIYHLFYRIQVT